MCKIGIIKILRNRFHPKHHSSNSNIIYIKSIKVYNIIITKVDKTDNFNPNATNVNNTYYDQEPADEESDDEEIDKESR